MTDSKDGSLDVSCSIQSSSLVHSFWVCSFQPQPRMDRLVGSFPAKIEPSQLDHTDVSGVVMLIPHILLDKLIAG